jgi:hypothetical protein
MTPAEHAAANEQPGWAAIFVPEPTSGWGFRGDPYVWRALAARLAVVDCPPAPCDAVEVVKAAFRELVGVGLDDDPSPDSVFRPEFDGGGISGGRISLTAWRDNLIPLLEQRVRTALDG